MPNVTLYVKDADLDAVNQAKKELGDSLSSVFVDCIRQRLAQNAPVEAMEKIALAFWNDNEQPVIHKSFMGRWLVGGANGGLRADDDDSGIHWDAGVEWSVAQTQKGAIVVYTQHCNDGHAPEMHVYDSFDDFKDAEHSGGGYPVHPSNVIASVAAALAVPYEIELDI